MGTLEHNKTIVVDGPAGQTVLCGSTNFSWRGFYVQSNKAMVLHGAAPVAVFAAAFENYWGNDKKPGKFGATPSGELTPLGAARNRRPGCFLTAREAQRPAEDDC